jgi:hypothetical protein
MPKRQLDRGKGGEPLACPSSNSALLTGAFHYALRTPCGAAKRER